MYIYCPGDGLKLHPVMRPCDGFTCCDNVGR